MSSDIQLYYRWFEYKQSDSIWIRDDTDYVTSKGFELVESKQEGKRDNYLLDIRVIIFFDNFGTKFKRAPKQMVDGFAKVGGMIAIINVWVAIKFLHKKCFERELTKYDENYQ